MDYNISTIEALTENEARDLAVEHVILKEHDIYFVDFGGYFGYSYLVFKDGHSIHYANDYELHHKGKSKEDLRKDRVSIFGINRTGEQQAEFERKISSMVYDPVAFAYYDDKDFVNHHIDLYNNLEKLLDSMEENYEYWKSAFLYEIYNNEYIYNWQADFDVLSCFGSLKYSEDAGYMKYMEQLGFNDVKKMAYIEALKEYYKETKEMC